MEDLFLIAGVTSFNQINDEKTQIELLSAYDKIFGGAKNIEKRDGGAELSFFDLIDGALPELETESQIVSSTIISGDKSKKKKSIGREELIETVKEYASKAISIPRIMVQPSTTLTLKPFKVKET